MGVACSTRAQGNVLELRPQLTCIVVRRLYDVEPRTCVSSANDDPDPIERLVAMQSICNRDAHPGRVEID